MILINVLPPEFRKRDTGVSPVFLAVVFGLLINLGIGAVLGYVRYVRLPHAEAHLADRNTVLSQKQQEAAQVQRLQGQIAQAKQRRQTLFGLLGQKVFHARPLNDFVSLLTSGSYSEPGFMVSISRLSISPGGGDVRRRGPSRSKAAGPELQEVTWDWSFKIVGEQRDMAGNYIESFFQRVANSDFWTENAFTGDPTETYRGDVPTWNETIERVVVDFPLQWTRVVPPVKFVTKPTDPVEQTGPAAQGGR
ncbi:MAG: hypothetical protein ACOCXA_07405 [Planctomycetota bacterium]